MWWTTARVAARHRRLTPPLRPRRKSSSVRNLLSRGMEAAFVPELAAMPARLRSVASAALAHVCVEFRADERGIVRQNTYVAPQETIDRNGGVATLANRFENPPPRKRIVRRSAVTHRQPCFSGNRFPAGRRHVHGSRTQRVGVEQPPPSERAFDELLSQHNALARVQVTIG